MYVCGFMQSSIITVKTKHQNVFIEFLAEEYLVKNDQSDQSTVYESIRTTRIKAKRSLNYIFYKDDNVSSEIDVADRMIDKYLDLINSSILNKDAIFHFLQS